MDDKRLKKVVKIFISSPGDVNPERSKAADIVTRLAKEFSAHFRIMPVLWEDVPLLATAAPQSSIPEPHDSDIVVVILWSRLGTPLFDKSGAVTGRQVTGTEWEFEDAFASYKESKKPDLLVYRKTQKVSMSPRDKRARKAMDALENFIERWFIDPADNVYKLALREFESTTEFEEMLEEHLRILLGGQHKQPCFISYKGNPFQGLYSFELEHTDIFFGRTNARNELRELLERRVNTGCAFVLVYGASGCGKSSLVKSGLLADLKSSGRIGKISSVYRYAVFRPADSPDDLLQGLANVFFSLNALPELAGLSFDRRILAEQLKGSPEQIRLPIRQALETIKTNPEERLTDRAEVRLILIIDQLEELFTSGLTAQIQAIFINILDVFSRSGLVWVIATLRSDFLDRLDQLPVLSRLASREALYPLKFPEINEIEQLIRKPADLAGLTFEMDKKSGADLADQLCKAVSQAPSSLPLLEFTLDQLWHTRSVNGELTFTAYNNLGGLEGALGRRAEATFAELPDDVQEVLPQVLRALSTIDQGSDAKVTARSASFGELSPSDPVHRLLAAFLDPQSRLLVSDGDAKSERVRVSHEALLTHWERAREQLEKDRSDLQIRSRLEHAAAIWFATTESNRNERLLPSGLPLAEAKDLLRRRRDELDSTVTDYINASIAAEQMRLKKEKGHLHNIIAGVSFIAVLALISAFMFYKLQTKADHERKIALSGKLAAQAALLAEYAVDDNMVERAAALVIESWRLLHNPQASEIANRLVRMLPKYRIQHGDTVMSLAFSPDGRLLATGSKDNMLKVIDVDTGNEQFRIAFNDWVTSVAFSPDGRLLATGSKDNTVRLIALAGHKEVSRLVQKDQVRKILFSPDGRSLAVAGKQGLVQLIDHNTGRALWKIAQNNQIMNIAFSPDGKLLAIAGEGGEALLIDAATGQALRRVVHGSQVNSVVFSADGRLLATASNDYSAQIIEVRSGRSLTKIKHRDAVVSVSFSPDSRWLATGSDDMTVKVTEVGTGKEVAEFVHKDGVFAVRFSPNGQLLATSSLDNTARLIDTATWREITKIPHGDAVLNIAFSPNSQWLATSSSDNSARLIETAKMPDDIKIAQQNSIMGLAFDYNNRYLATASTDNTARWYEYPTGTEKKVFQHDDIVYGVAFSWDRRFFATASKDHTAKLINIASGNEIAVIRHDGEVRNIAFSPDSRLLATASLDKSFKLTDTESGQLQRIIKIDDPIETISFSFTGQLVAVASKKGLVRLMDTKTEKLSQEIQIAAPISGLAVSPDARLIATAGADGIARLIDVAAKKPVAEFQHPKAILSVIFSPDGRQLAINGEDMTVRLIDLSSGKNIASIHSGSWISAVVFSPDSKMLAIGGLDGSIRFVETATGLEIQQIIHDDEIWAVAFTPDGQMLAVGAKDGHVHLLDSEPQKIFDQLCDKPGRNLSGDELRDYLGLNAPHPTCMGWRAPEDYSRADLQQ